MRNSKRAWLALACVVLLVPAVGCSNDPTDVPADQAVEAGMNAAITGTVVPLVQFMGAVGNLLTAPIAPRVVQGLACPDTTGWCTSGTVTCTPGGNGLDFDFNACRIVTGDAPLVLEGAVTVLPGSPILLTLTNLHINDSAGISGAGSIDTNACNYFVNVNSSGTTVQGTVTQCSDDNYPTGQTVGIGFDGYLVTITLNGTNTAPAIAMKDGDPVADCTLDLDTLTTSCDAL